MTDDLREGSKPRRIQRKRTKGWKMPPNTVYVGRPTKWGNPFRMDANTSRWKAVDEYRRTFAERMSVDFIRRELRGKNLACFCHEDQPCHADVLLEIANQKETKP